MKAKTFIGWMFLLLVFTTVLVVLALPRKQAAQKSELIQPVSVNAPVPAAEGSMIWDAFSGHVLSALQ